MIRAVLDTNVLVSAMVNPRGIPAEIVREIALERVVAVSSAPLLAEHRAVAGRAKILALLRRSGVAPRLFLQAFEARVELVVSPLPVVRAVAADPSDDVVLATALAGGAGWVVTGDRRHLLPLDPFHGIRIVEPAVFLAEIARQGA